MKAMKGQSSATRQRKELPDDYWFQALSGKMLKKDVERYAKAVGENASILLKWSLHPEFEIANRASWIFRTWADLHTDQLESSFNAIFKVIQKTTNGSVIRNLSGIWYDHSYPEKYDSKVIDLCLSILGNTNYAIAAYANLLGILKYPCKRYPELKEEVRLQAMRHPLAEETAFQKRLNEALKA